MLDLAEVIFEIAGGDQDAGEVCEEGPSGVPDALEGGGIAVGLAGKNDVQQQRGNGGIGEVGRNARAHSPGAQNGDTSDGAHGNDSARLSPT